MREVSVDRSDAELASSSGTTLVRVGFTSCCQFLLPMLNLLADFGRRGRAVALERGDGLLDAEDAVDRRRRATVGRLEVVERQVGQPAAAGQRRADELADQVVGRPLRQCRGGSAIPSASWRRGARGRASRRSPRGSASAPATSGAANSKHNSTVSKESKIRSLSSCKSRL